MNDVDESTPWQDLGYEKPAYTLPNEQQLERSAYQKERACRCFEELRRILESKNE